MENLRTPQQLLAELSQLRHELDRIQAELETQRRQEQTLKALLDATSEAALMLNATGTVLTLNRASAERFDKKPEEILGKNVCDLLLPESAQVWRENLQRLIAGRAPLRFTHRWYGRLLENDLYPIFDNKRNPVQIAVFSRDITEYQQAEEEIKKSEAKFRAIFEKSGIGILLLDIDRGQVLECNSALEQLLGYSGAELRAMSLLEIIHPDDRDVSIKTYSDLKNGRFDSYQAQKRYRRKDGIDIWGQVTSSLVPFSGEKPHLLISMIEDITERKELDDFLQQAVAIAEDARRKAEELARTDSLTGLLNQRALLERFRAELEEAEQNDICLSLILTDIDHFKQINDNYGHPVGDAALKKFSECLLANCRPSDFVGRSGGEEFIIGLPNTPAENALIVAERLRSQIGAITIHPPDGSEFIGITASFGIATYTPGSAASVESLIRDADEAMYRAKNSGRNCIRVYSAAV